MPVLFFDDENVACNKLRYRLSALTPFLLFFFLLIFSSIFLFASRLTCSTFETETYTKSQNNTYQPNQPTKQPTYLPTFTCT